jgi:hypothetical protein
MLVAGNLVLQVAGAIVLSVFALIVAGRIGANDPLMGRELKEFLGKSGTADKILDP